MEKGERMGMAEMSREIIEERVVESYVALCKGFGLPISVVQEYRREGEIHWLEEGALGWTVGLNTAHIPPQEGEAFLAYNVRKVLLPRLVLRTPRLVVRRVAQEDGEGLLPILSDPVGCDLDCCAPCRGEAFWELFQLFCQQETRYVLVEQAAGRVVGTLHLTPDPTRAVEAMELGYAIAPAHRRQGYAQEALEGVGALLQGKLGMELLTAGVLPENHPSARLLEKLGFSPEGVRRKAAWHEGRGQAVDLVYYTLERT